MTTITKLHIQFAVDIEQIPEILNRVLPVGVYDFKTQFVHLNGGEHSNPLLLPPPSRKPGKMKRVTNGTKPGPSGRAAKIVRRVLSHMPDLTASSADIGKAMRKAGMTPNNAGVLRALIDAGEIKRVGWGTYTLVRS